LKIALYSAPAYLDTTIPLVNELSKKNEVHLIIEYHGESNTGIWQADAFSTGKIVFDEPNEIGRFLGSDLTGILDDKIKVAVVNYPSIKMTSRWRYISTCHLIKYLHRIKPDVIDIHSPHGVLAMPFLPNVVKVFTLHDPFPHMGEKSWGGVVHNRLGMHYADYVIVHDKESAGSLSRMYRFLSSKLATVYLGVYAVYRRWLGAEIPEEENTILFFGRISPYKGLEYLIKAEPLIAKEIENLKIIVAGKGDLSPYRKLIVNPKIYEIHNQYISNESAGELFQRARCVVLPYTDATQSGVLMTAYAFNKPAIVTDVGGLPEVVEDGVTGFVVPPKDGALLARAIIKLLKDDDLRKEMKNNIKSKAENEFSWQRIAGQIVEIYRKKLSS